jgi:hypothetical protein
MGVTHFLIIGILGYMLNIPAVLHKVGPSRAKLWVVDVAVLEL